MENQEETTSCGHEFPHFGASYPDAGCIDGRLWDLDSYDDGFLTQGGDDPCPWCNTEEYIEQLRDNEEEEEHIKKHLQFLSETYGAGDTIVYITPTHSKAD